MHWRVEILGDSNPEQVANTAAAPSPADSSPASAAWDFNVQNEIEVCDFWVIFCVSPNCGRKCGPTRYLLFDEHDRKVLVSSDVCTVWHSLCLCIDALVCVRVLLVSSDDERPDLIRMMYGNKRSGKKYAFSCFSNASTLHCTGDRQCSIAMLPIASATR